MAEGMSTVFEKAPSVVCTCLPCPSNLRTSARTHSPQGYSVWCPLPLAHPASPGMTRTCLRIITRMSF